MIEGTRRQHLGDHRSTLSLGSPAAVGLVLIPLIACLWGCSERQMLARCVALDQELHKAHIEMEPDAGLEKEQAVRQALMSYQGGRRAAIFQHPPSTIRFSGLRLDQDPLLRFRLAVSEKAWRNGCDGVGFEILVQQPGRQPITVFDHELLPTEDRKAQEGQAHEVSLEDFSGQQIDLLLRTDSGPNGTTTQDHAWWVEPELITSRPATNELPNVILISFDTLRADYLGCYGFSRPTSPVIDALASSGTLFERCTSQSAWTRPAHFSMLTSLYPDRKLLCYDELDCRVVPSVTTLTEELGAEGYVTAAFTGGGYVGSSSGLEQGFDIFRSYGRRFEDSVGAVSDWITGHSRYRFFLFLHNYNAHRPFDPPEEARKELVTDVPQACTGVVFDAADRRSGRWHDCIKAPGGVEYMRALYAAEVLYADRLLGQVLETLELAGVGDDTTIVFTSDHGEELYDHGGTDHISTMFQELIHVPLIMSGPGVPRGLRIASQVESIDIAPTVLDLLGLQGIEGAQGRSLRPAFDGQQLAPKPAFSASSWSPDLAAFKNSRFFAIQAIIDGDLKLITREGPHHSSTLRYDLTTDHKEQRQLGRLDREAWGPMSDSLEEWVAATGKNNYCYNEKIDAETLAQLKALGYLDS